MGWKVLFFETPRGEKPVKEFMCTLEEKTQAKAIRTIDLLETYGNRLPMPYSKKVSGKLYELRIRGKEQIRLFYAFGKGREVYLVHGFKKKGNKIPKKEIKIAESRIDNI